MVWGRVSVCTTQKSAGIRADVLPSLFFAALGAGSEGLSFYDPIYASLVSRHFLRGLVAVNFGVIAPGIAS